jgi:hypothetical protein
LAALEVALTPDEERRLGARAAADPRAKPPGFARGSPSTS